MARRGAARNGALWSRFRFRRSSPRRPPSRRRVGALPWSPRLGFRRARYRRVRLLRHLRTCSRSPSRQDPRDFSFDGHPHPSRRLRRASPAHHWLPMTAMSQVDVVGVGLNATDTLIPLHEYPARGSKVEFEAASILPGGQVASAVVACQSWGLRTRYVGKFGDDYPALLHRTEFEQAGVDAHLFTAPNCPSHQSFILIDADGERTVLRRHDERLALRPAELQREWITSARALLVDRHDTPAAILAAEWARAAKIPVVADLDDLYTDIETLLPN